MRAGALCAGYGGLEAGLASVTDVDLAWYAEYDAAPSAIMARHHPGITNLHDVTAIDWAALEPVDVLTAGYPCQPFSAAGMRRGEDDPRHLWPHIAKGIAILCPPLCVFENVRGHLSLGFDKVLHDLHRLGYDVRWYLLRAADVGAAHGRARLFIFATDRSTVPAADLPAGAPVAVAGGDGWLAPESGLFGAEPFAGKLPPCGRMVEGHLYATPRWLSRPDEPLLPTPSASQSGGTAEAHRERKRRSMGRTDPTCTDLGLLVAELAEGVPLLPTPTTEPTTGNGHARSLGGEVSLLPTPSVADVTGGRKSRSGDRSGELLLNGIAAANRWGDYAPAIARWEAVIGRPAPAPTEPGAKGGHRLAPRFVEWMQGLPEGHVTDPAIGLTRNNQLKALGNGVVPQQCAAAYRAFLADEMRAAA